MDAVSVHLHAVIADARRAAIPGAIGDSPDRAGAIVVAPLVAQPARRSTPSASPLSVTIDGSGLFAFEDAGRRAYGRLGDFRFDSRGVLVDGAGRTVLGYAPEAARPAGDLHAIRIAPSDAAAKRFSDFTVDERGVVSGVVRSSAASPAGRGQQVIALGRIALAVFPAPERLHRIGDTIAIATADAGIPLIAAPGDTNVGMLHSHSLETGLVDLESDLARLWSLERDADIGAATAWAGDVFARTAMGLVK